MAQADVGVIGGSGLYQMDGLSDLEEVFIDTPFGPPSDAFVLGTLQGVRVAFVPRHGRGHRLLPSEVPYRANIYALKTLGVRQVIAASAVGSLRDEYRPLDMAVPEQLFDRTKARPNTFFGDGIVAHIEFAHPFCKDVSEALVRAGRAVVERTHQGGTYVCIEGPAFSSYAESQVYRRLGFDLIGMTALPEAKLAREAELCYGMLAQVTDYDCWHEGHDTVTSDMVIANVAKNAANAQEILRRVIPAVASMGDCPCHHALQGAIVTDLSVAPPESLARLAPLLRSYIPQRA